MAATWEAALAHRLGDTRADEQLVPRHGDLVAAVERPAETVDELAQALIVAAPTWRRSRAPERWLERAAEVLQGAPSADTHRQLALARAVFCEWDPHLVDLGRRSAEEASALAADTPGDRAHAQLLLAGLHRRQHHHDASVAAMDEAEKALEEVEPGALHVYLAMRRGVLDIQRQRHTEARAHLLHALELSSRHEVRWCEPLICVNLAVLLSWEGRRREQIGMAQRALLRAREHRQRVNEQRALLMLAVAESEAGSLEAAAHHCADLVDSCELDHNYPIAADAYVVLAGIELARQHHDDADDAVRNARRLAAHVRAPWHVAWIDWWEALTSWARWGSLDEARHLLEQGLAKARGHLPVGELSIEARLLAARAHLDPDAGGALRSRLRDLEQRAHAMDRQDVARTIAIDRLHVDLAEGNLAPVRAELQVPAALDPAVHGLGVVVARLLLASSLATREQPCNSGSFSA